jgi:hypothetical protein
MSLLLSPKRKSQSIDIGHVQEFEVKELDD